MNFHEEIEARKEFNRESFRQGKNRRILFFAGIAIAYGWYFNDWAIGIIAFTMWALMEQIGYLGELSHLSRAREVFLRVCWWANFAVGLGLIAIFGYLL